MVFDYMQRVVIDGQLTVDNVGECIIQATNDIGEQWFLFIKTELGWSEIIDYGPHLPDFDMLSPNFQIKYSRVEYNQSRLEKYIDRFLNEPKRIITQAKVVTFDELADIEFVNPIYKVFLKVGE